MGNWRHVVYGGGGLVEKVRWCLMKYLKCAAENIRLTVTVFHINCNDLRFAGYTG